MIKLILREVYLRLDAETIIHKTAFEGCIDRY